MTDEHNQPTPPQRESPDAPTWFLVVFTLVCIAVLCFAGAVLWRFLF